MKRRVLSFLLAFALLISGVPFSAFAADTDPALVVETRYAAANATIEVDIQVVNNPGIAGARIFVSFSDKLTLVGAASGETFAALDYTAPANFASGCAFNWDSMDAEVNEDGILLTLTFETSADAVPNEELSVEVSYNSGDIYTSDLQELEFDITNGIITIIDYTPGDVNSDDVINNKDVTLIRRHNGGYDVTINEAAADVNNSGTINGMDVTLIRRFNAGWPVELLPSTPKCSHTMESVAYTAPTCTETGNVTYYHCTTSDKYFNDAAGTTEIDQQITVLPATGHTLVVIPAVEPTDDTPGWTEGEKCSVCGLVTVEPVEIWRSQYEIRYNLYDNDTYLEKIGVENPNKATYTAESGLKLVNLESPGYIFEGWFDGQGASAEQIKEIPVGTTGVVYLYAKWTPVPYTITFDSPIDMQDSQTYYVNTGATLPNPEYYGYTFTGWTDDEGKLVSSTVSTGTVGNFTLHANWTAKRNQTIPVKELGEPMFHEDEELGVYVWVYEIGRIENVPLYTIKDFGYNSGAGITWSETVESSVEITEEYGENVSNTVSNATMKSSSWTLSQGWNESTEISKTHSSEVSNETNAEAQAEFGRTNSWNIGSSTGGSTTTSTETGVSAKVGYEQSASVKAKGTIGVADVEAEAGYKLSGEVGGSYTNTEENSKNWNVSSGYESGYSASNSFSLSHSISSTVSDTYHYGQSYDTSEEWSESSDLATTETEEREYGSTFNYVTGTMTTTTKTYTNEGATAGYYRLVASGTIHVFAVVGYDIATRSYFTYTYSVMDDEIKDFMDYSASTSHFDDLENGVLPFAVPYEIDQFVNQKVVATKGLEIDIETGTITGYTGEADHVMIPEYVVKTNEAGTTTVVKVTGIASNAFAGKTGIVEIKLPDSVTAIPAGAFAGCTSLTNVIGKNITDIGEGAFSGCSALDNYTITTQITSLGANAFDGAGEVIATARNAKIAKAVAESGANQITLKLGSMVDTLSDYTFTIPAGATSFMLNGGGRTYSGVRVVSDAMITTISDATFSGCDDTPLVISSPSVTLESLTVNASGLAMQLTAETASLKLYSSVNMVSTGANSVLTNNVSISQAQSGVSSALRITGDMLVCGVCTGQNYVDQTNGKIIPCESGSFFVTFDPNGGTVEETSRIAVSGATMGTLPVPTRDYYTFLGWFTAAEGGEQYTADTVVASPTDFTLYAHWELNPVSDWVLVSELPEGAEVVDQKWTYTQKYTAESQNTSMDGYTQVGSYWKQSGSGSKNYSTEFHKGFSTSHWIYTSFAKSPLTAYETATTKRTVTDSWGGYVYWHWMYSVNYANTTTRAISPYSGYWSADGTSGSGYNYKYFYAFTSTTNCAYLDTGYCCSQNMKSYNCHSILPSDKNTDHIGTPRFFRFNYRVSSYVDYVKIFQYEKYVEQESATEVTASSTISNVQQWVQYRAK